jgi:hypothetical protein
MRRGTPRPRANLKCCAEQIGMDYVISWRPNPTDMLCAGFDEGLVRRTIREGLRICKGLCLHLHLKDIKTVEGEPLRLVAVDQNRQRGNREVLTLFSRESKPRSG